MTLFRYAAFLFAASLVPVTAHAQLSLATAVDLALSSSPRVKAAQDDIDKARALVSESRDVYIPNVVAGAALGESFGYNPQPPTLFTFNSQSLVYNGSQRAYIRSAEAGLQAASLAMADARAAVAEDTALAYAALAHDSERELALRQQSSDAERLVGIVSDRFDAGRDTALDLNGAKLTAAQLRLALLHTQTEAVNDRAHLAALVGLPAESLRVDGAFPPSNLPPSFTPSTATLNPSVAAAFANAAAKQAQARGDARYLYRPQVALAVQYSRYATFTDSFNQLQELNPTQNQRISANNEAFGIQINLPLFDKGHQAKARESAADASRAFHDAQNAQFQALTGQVRLSNSLAELRAHAEVSTLEQQRAQLQLDALTAELNAAPVEGRPPLTPKDEQNARIAEREKYLAVLDATYQIRQAEINLLRQTGQIEAWVRNAATP